MVKKPRPEMQGRVQRRKRKKKRKIIGWIVIPIIIVILAGVGWGIHLYTKAGSAISDSYEEIDRGDNEENPKPKADPEKDNISILLMGIDESEHRENEGSARTDALILATLNKEENSVKLLSIPRDSLVYIPELGHEDKINHAHALGEGPVTTIEAVENLLDLDAIDYYARVNFSAFVQVVEALDGITVDVPYEFWESDSNDRRDAIHLTEGEQVLNGEEALALARTRKHDNDVERGKRQLDIIKALIDKTASLSSVLKYGKIIDALDDNMAMNMKTDDITSLISYGTSDQGLDIETYTLEGTDYWSNSVYYWLIDEEKLASTKTKIHKHLGINETQSAEKDNHQDPNREAYQSN